MSAPLPPVPLPQLVNLESTLGCNLACVMCGSHLSGVTQQHRTMSPELLQRIEAEVLPAARDGSLTVAGEPFMTPKLRVFVELAERTDTQLQFNSNATLIRDTPTIRRAIAGASVVKFSVDGASPEIYEGIRVGGELDKVLENIRTAVRIRGELPPHQRPRMALCMVLMKRNLHELCDMIDLAHGLGVDRLEVAHLTVLTEALEQEHLRHHAEAADAALRAARAHADALAFRVHLPPLMDGSRLPVAPAARARLALQEARELTRTRVHRLGTTLARKARMAAWSRRAGGRVPCHFLQDAVFITIGGDVAPCPMPGRPLVGNLLERSFEELWNGEVLTAMRRGFLEGRPFECCAHCSQNPEGYEPGDPETARPPVDYPLAAPA